MRPSNLATSRVKATPAFKHPSVTSWSKERDTPLAQYSQSSIIRFNMQRPNLTRSQWARWRLRTFKTWTALQLMSSPMSQKDLTNSFKRQFHFSLSPYKFRQASSMRHPMKKTWMRASMPKSNIASTSTMCSREGAKWPIDGHHHLRLTCNISTYRGSTSTVPPPGAATTSLDWSLPSEKVSMWEKEISLCKY